MTIFSFDPPKDSLRKRATMGVVKTGLSQGVRLLIQVGSVVLLSRLLMPSEFGLLAMVGPIVGFASLFQDLGLTQAIVQKARITQAEISALFWVSVGMGVAVAALLCAISPAVSWFYGDARAGVLTAALGVNVIVSGAGSLHFALLNRRMQFGALAIIDVSAGLGGLVLSGLVAFLYHTYWALYAGSVASTLIPCVGYWIASKWRPSLPRRGSGVGAALNFGANVTGFNVANFFSRNLDNVLIGRVWGDRPLGLYDRAYKLMLLPLQQINGPISKVMLPVLSQMSGDPARYSQAFIRVQSQMLFVTIPGIAFMVGTADLLVPILLGRQWAEASPIFVALGMASFVQALNNSIGWLFVSQHRTKEYMYWGLFNSVVCVVSFLIGLPYGPVGVAAGYAIGEFLRTPGSWWLVTRRGPLRARAVIGMALPHYVGGLASFAAIAGVRTIHSSRPFLVLGFSLLASFLASIVTLAVFPRGRVTLRQTLEQIPMTLAHVLGR